MTEAFTILALVFGFLVAGVLFFVFCFVISCAIYPFMRKIDLWFDKHWMVDDDE